MHETPKWFTLDAETGKKATLAGYRETKNLMPAA